MKRGQVLTSPSGWVIRQISFVLMTGFLFIATAFAQNVGGKLSGRATDPSGAIIPGVRITVQSSSTNVVSTTQSDGSGYYQASEFACCLRTTVTSSNSRAYPDGTIGITDPICSRPDAPTEPEVGWFGK